MKSLSIMYGIIFPLMGLFLYTNSRAMALANQPLQATRNSSDIPSATALCFGGAVSACTGGILKLICLVGETVDQRGVQDELYQCDCDYGWFPACSKVYYCSAQTVNRQESCPCFCNCVAYSTSGCIVCGGLCVGSGLLVVGLNLFKNYKERGDCCIWN